MPDLAVDSLRSYQSELPTPVSKSRKARRRHGSVRPRYDRLSWILHPRRAGRCVIMRLEHGQGDVEKNQDSTTL